MKNNYFNFFLVVVFTLINIISFGQIKSITPKINGTEKITYLEIKAKSKLSPSTQVFLSNYRNKLKILNNVTNKNNVDYVNVFIMTENENSEDVIKNLTPYFRKKTNNIYTALIPISNIEGLENNSMLKYIDIGETLSTEMFNVRTLTHVDEVQSGQGLSQSYSGQGVIVGIIDRGFDYTHPNFKDSNGNLRITKVWEQGNNSGIKPSNFSYGSEYINSTQILSKQFDINSGIGASHGTHVTGIAAGTGTGSVGLLTGVAPNSEIVLVSYSSSMSLTGTDDNNTTNTYLSDAVGYLLDYADSVNKPIVINISSGSNLGPHDGTTLSDLTFDYIANNNQGKSKIIVKSAGNDSGYKTHVHLQYTSVSDKVVLDSQHNGWSTIDFWANNSGINSSFDIQFGVYNISTSQFESNIANGTISGTINQSITLNDVDTNGTDQWFVNAVAEINPINNRPHLRLVVNATNNESAMLNQNLFHL